MEKKNKRSISLTAFILTLIIMLLACCLLIYLISTNKIGNKASDTEITTEKTNNEIIIKNNTTSEVKTNETEGNNENSNIKTIKPSLKISKLLTNYSEAEEYITSSLGKSSAIEFYENEIPVGDAVWKGLVSEYKASSTYNKDKTDYNANNLGDLYIDKCWCEGKDGDGIGETIEVNTFASCEKVEWNNTTSKQRSMKSIDDTVNYLRENNNSLSNYYSEINQIAIINGYAKNNELWKNNNRVKKLKLTIDNDIEYILELDDTKDLQLFDINYKNDDITKKINLKFEILNVYAGEKYDDTCITSIYLAGGSNIQWGGR